jgi:hypothetical protein
MYTVWAKHILLLLKQVVPVVTTVPSNGLSVVVTIYYKHTQSHDVFYFLVRHCILTRKLFSPHLILTFLPRWRRTLSLSLTHTHTHTHTQTLSLTLTHTLTHCSWVNVGLQRFQVHFSPSTEVPHSAHLRRVIKCTDGNSMFLQHDAIHLSGYTQS